MPFIYVIAWLTWQKQQKLTCAKASNKYFNTILVYVQLNSPYLL